MINGKTTMATAFQLGYRARGHFEPMSENPHAGGGQAWGDWNDGWRRARLDFLPCPICREGYGCGHSLEKRKAAAGGDVDYITQVVFPQ